MYSVQDDDYDILCCYKILSSKNFDYDLEPNSMIELLFF